MNAPAWLLSIAIVSAVVAIAAVMFRMRRSLFGPRRRKDFGSVAVAIALLGLERFIRPAQEHVMRANDGETDQDTIGAGLGPQKWIAQRSTIRPEELLVDEDEST